VAVIWNIHHRDREFAFVNGDPVLGTVYADSQEEAERKGAHLGRQAGILAVRIDKDGEKILKLSTRRPS